MAQQLEIVVAGGVRGLKQLITPLLARLLANETDQALSFEDFFRSVQEIAIKDVVYVFHTATCNILHIYLPSNSRYRTLHAAVACLHYCDIM